MELHIYGINEWLNNLISIINEDAETISDKRQFGMDKIVIVVYSDKPNYQELINAINSNNMKADFMELREYTKKEYDAAPYFHVNIPSPWENSTANAETYGTKFKQGECCRTQLSNLYIDTKKIGKKHFVHIKPEIIVSKYAQDIIVSENLLGCEFRPVVDVTSNAVSEFFQLVITSILPPMSESVRTVSYGELITAYESCVKKGYLRSEIIYHQQDMIEAKDFNLTFEYLNAYFSRQLIASAKVRKIFNKYKIKINDFEPIHIID